VTERTPSGAAVRSPARVLGGKRCSARNRAGEPCRAFAVRGATVCIAHGGAAPQVRAAAARRVEAAKLSKDIGRTLEDVERSLLDAGVGPADTLADASTRAAAMMVVASSRLEELTTEGPNGESADVVAELYERWVALAAKVSKLALDANIDERRVAILDREAEAIGAVLDALRGTVLAWLRSQGAEPTVVGALDAGWPSMFREAIEISGVKSTPTQPRRETP
jgi:hypothetical protein